MAVPAHLRSAKVPGGSLLAALFDRQLQAWSDRGGASQHIGERWSRLVAEELSSWVGRESPAGGAGPSRLRAVIWLDARPEIARHAGRHGLTNPDFVLVHELVEGGLILQPADAKFAVQVVKPEQIRARALRALLDSGNPALERELSQRLPGADLRRARVVDGFVVSPAGILTEHYLPRLVDGPGARLRPHQVVTLVADPRRLFAGLPVARLVGVLAGIDRLPVKPRRTSSPRCTTFAWHVRVGGSGRRSADHCSRSMGYRRSISRPFAPRWSPVPQRPRRRSAWWSAGPARRNRSGVTARCWSAFSHHRCAAASSGSLSRTLA